MPTDREHEGDSAHSKQSGDHRTPVRASLGFDFAAAVAGLTLIGWAVDRFQGTAPWGLLIGAAIGIIGGLYNSLKAAGVIGKKSKGA